MVTGTLCFLPTLPANVAGESHDPVSQVYRMGERESKGMAECRSFPTQAALREGTEPSRYTKMIKIL